MVQMKTADALSWPAKDSYSSEEYFQRMLILERLRSEQSGKPFMLILLDIGKLLKGKRTEKAFVLRRLISVLNSSTCAIDLKGWYMLDSIIGIICQDVQGRHHDAISGRIKDTFREKGIFHVVGNAADAIKFLCLLYPDS
jgi:hypothetical protein